jgi:hypothetical protein
MAVRLISGGNGLYDIRFGIEEREADKLDWTVGMDYSIECSRRCIPKEHRPAVLEYIVESLGLMVDQCLPRKVTMESFYRNLPDKALRKYERISEMMVGRGFTAVKHRDGTTEKDYWLFERTA